MEYIFFEFSYRERIENKINIELINFLPSTFGFLFRIFHYILRTWTFAKPISDLQTYIIILMPNRFLIFIQNLPHLTRIPTPHKINMHNNPINKKHNTNTENNGQVGFCHSPSYKCSPCYMISKICVRDPHVSQIQKQR